MSYFFCNDDAENEILVEGKSSRKIRAFGGNLMCVEALFEKGGVGQLHNHPHEQVTYCLSGEFEFTIGDEVILVRPGDSLYIPPDIIHGCVLKSDEGRVLDIFTPIREDFIKKGETS